MKSGRTTTWRTCALSFARYTAPCYLALGCVLAVLASSDSAYGGKLGAIRSAAKGKSKAAPSKPAPQRPSSSTPPAPESHDHEEEHTAAHHEPVRTARSTAKLNRIRTAVATDHDHDHAAHRPARRSHRQRRRSPRHDQFGVNFYSHYSAPPVCLPTVVEEHYYEPQPVFITEPVVLPAAPSIAASPVVAPGTPSIVSPVAPQVDYVEQPIVVAHAPFDSLDDFQVRFEIDYAIDEADVDRSGFGLLVNATGGLGIDTGVRIFRESDAEFRDHLWMGDFNIVYELFPTEFARTRAGIGVNWLADRYGSDAGFNLTVGTDLFAGPFIFSGEADLGTLGEADLFHGRLTAALRQGDHLEWFAGYDFLDIGGTEIRGVVGGLRFRF